VGCVKKRIQTTSLDVDPGWEGSRGPEFTRKLRKGDPEEAAEQRQPILLILLLLIGVNFVRCIKEKKFKLPSPVRFLIQRRLLLPAHTPSTADKGEPGTDDGKWRECSGKL
jgi:hypothetical protein